VNKIFRRRGRERDAWIAKSEFARFGLDPALNTIARIKAHMHTWALTSRISPASSARRCPPNNSASPSSCRIERAVIPLRASERFSLLLLLLLSSPLVFFLSRLVPRLTRYRRDVIVSPPRESAPGRQLAHARVSRDTRIARDARELAPLLFLFRAGSAPLLSGDRPRGNFPAGSNWRGSFGIDRSHRDDDACTRRKNAPEVCTHAPTARHDTARNAKRHERETRRGIRLVSRPRAH
jgi:hypothetical protein